MNGPRICRKSADRKHARHGAILVFAMIALLVASMIGASLVRTAVASYRQLQREQQQMQTTWLADAGCQRAITRMHSEPRYEGEEWLVSGSQMHVPFSSQVKIAVEKDPQSDDQRIVTIIAECPKDVPQCTRVTRHLTVKTAGQNPE